jgi:hypothetical protein
LSHANYLAKLKLIRDQLRTGLTDAVMAYHQSTAREDLPKLLGSYESVRALDRIIAAEEARVLLPGELHNARPPCDVGETLTHPLPTN